MEHWDAQLEQRVWRRVRGEPEEGELLPELVGLSRQQAAELRGVDRILYRQERQTLMLLEQLLILAGGKVPTPGKVLPGNREQRLRRCRERCGRMLQAMVALESHDRYGALFTELTRQQRAKCARLNVLADTQPGIRRY